MVKHIVLFQFKAELSEATKKEARERFKNKIMALPAQLSIIREIEVGFNLNPNEQWDICLNSSFDSLEDVAFYSNYPDHQAAAKELKAYLSGRSCVDYQF